jgi:hypothetical protein
MKNAIEGMHSSAGDALFALGDTISNYIMENTQINFSWNGIQPGPTPVPDPKVTTTGKIMGLSFQLTPSLAISQAEAINHLKNELITGLNAAQYNITEAGFTTAPQSMSTSPGINSLNITISSNDRDSALGQLANHVVTWIKSQVPTGALIGSHGAFTAPAGAGGMVTTIT